MDIMIEHNRHRRASPELLLLKNHIVVLDKELNMLSCSFIEDFMQKMKNKNERSKLMTMVRSVMPTKM